MLEKETEEVKEKVKGMEEELEKLREEGELMREARDQAVKEGEDSGRRLEVLTEFFNKKEAELQKQLGLQCARFGDVSTDAESTAKKLLSVMTELESTQGALKVVKGELEEQEKSLKAAVAGQEKKAHENWVAARQAERKLTDLQGEMGILRNRLIAVEAKNNALEQEKEDLQNTITAIQNTKPEPVNGMTNSLDSLPHQDNPSGPSSLAGTPFQPIEPALPPLPGLPCAPPAMGLLPALPGAMISPRMLPPMLPPPLLDSRPPPVGRMSPGPRDRRFSNRSPSPDYDPNYRRQSSPPRYRPHSPSPPRYRDSSPSSRRSSPYRGHRRPSPTRSERGGSPYRRRPSPARSERGYNRSYNEPRYYNGTSSSRNSSPDRYSSRSDRYQNREKDSYRDGDSFRNESRRRRDNLLLQEPAKGPKTSSPLDNHVNYGV